MALRPNRRYAPSKTVDERLWPRIDASADCWEWTGATTKGYGVIFVGGYPHMAYTHRVVWERLVGPIEDDYELDHLCRNKVCANPDHLELVSHKTNVLRGWSDPARRARKTQCKRGHAFTDKNTYVTPSGHRQCRTCHRDQMREAYRVAV